MAEQNKIKQQHAEIKKVYEIKINDYEIKIEKNNDEIIFKL
jgi:hypothetical protein